MVFRVQTQRAVLALVSEARRDVCLAEFIVGLDGMHLILEATTGKLIGLAIEACLKESNIVQ